MVKSVLILILIMLIVPMLMGLVPCYFVSKERRSISTVFISGIVLELSLFQLIAVPFVIGDGFGFPNIVLVYSIVLACMSVAGIVLTVLTVKKNKAYFSEATMKRNLTVEEIVEWVMAAGIIIFQIIMFVRMASFDGDDAYYVVESLLSYETDTLYRIRPYTGLSTGMDLRHSLAVVPIWMAYIARVCGIHPTIVTHNVYGIMSIPLTYLIYLETGRCLLKKERKKLPIFMIFVGIMQVFGNVSIYTTATFFITRTWQGKSMLANIVIPVTIWLLLNIFDSEVYEKDNRLGLWIVLFMNNIVAAMCSTTSVLLMAMLVGVSGLVLSIKEKNPQVLLKLIVTCIPLVAYGCMFLLM